jgi:hypothetical protein
MKIIHEIIDRGKGDYGSGENQLTREQLLRIYDETRSISSLILTTSGTSGAATYNSVTGVLNIPNYTQQAVDGFVPYTGATQNLNLGAKQLITDAIQFSLLPTALDAVGKMKWNPDAGTMDIGMGYPDVVQQVGMETYYPPVKNQTGSTIPDGTVVMAVDTLGASGRILIAPAIADGSVPSRFMLGITTHEIGNGEDGVVTWFGLVRKFNTDTKAPAGETWIDGDVLWINPAIPGGLTKVEPSAPNLKVSIAFIVHAGNNGTIMVRPSLGMRLTDLHDVNAFTPSSNDLIAYNGVKWENKSIASLGIATVAQLHDPVTIATPANGLAITAGQELLLGLASSGATGALSSTDWSTFSAKIGGTIASGQVAFGTGSGVIGGGGNLTWDSVNNRLFTGTASSFPWSSSSLEVRNGLRVYDPASSSFGLRHGFNSNVPYIQGFRETIGVINLQLQPSGGQIWIGTTSGTNTLDVNGTARIRTISNLGYTATEFLTQDPLGVISKRTASEALADIGGIGGTIASGQVAFGTGAGVIGGDSGLTWDNVDKRIIINNIELETRSDDVVNFNSLDNSIESGSSINTISGGGSSTFPNKIGIASLPNGTDYSPTGWSIDSGYVTNSATVALISGGYDHINNQQAGVIVGGGHNFLKYDLNGHSFIGGGSYNIIEASRCFIGAGRANSISGGATSPFSIIVGGDQNEIIGGYNAIIGGDNNLINGTGSLIHGRSILLNGLYSYSFGLSNSVTSSFSFSTGRRNIITADGVFSASDNQNADFTTSTANTFNTRFSGGYRITGGNFGIGGTAIEKLHVYGSILQTAITSSLLKADSNGKLIQAVAGTDYQTPITNPISGSGSVNQVAIFNGTNSIIGDSGFNYIPSSGILSLNNKPNGYLLFDQRKTSFTTGITGSAIYQSGSGGTYPFDNIGHLVIQSRSSQNRDIVLVSGSTPSVIARFGVSGVSIGDIAPTNTIDVNGTARIRTSAFISSDSGNTIIGGLVDTGLAKLQVNGDATITNALISNQSNTDVDSAAPEVVAQISSTTYTAAFFDYVVKNGANQRAGTVYATHDGTNVVFTETMTQDLGDTSGVEFEVDLSGGQIRLVATVATDNWSIKTLVRGL